MIGGQLLDLEGEGGGGKLGLSEREAIHSAKTGALIRASALMGALAAGAGRADCSAFESFGRSLGLAFQILDDVLDASAPSAERGKKSGRDAELGKSTYPALLGIEGARERARALVEEGVAGLAARGKLTAKLRELANFMLLRVT